MTVLAEIDEPPMVALDLIEDIAQAIINHPRSQQVEIGPSELGTPCSRALLFKLAHVPEPEDRLPWLPTIGVAVHNWLAGVFEHSICGPDRYLVEHRVTVGQVAGVDISGSSDLFDKASGTVIDWKIIGKGPLTEYRRGYVRPEYRIQCHLYARGFVLAGYTVNNVMLMYLPRNEIELSYRVMWSEPYSEEIALAALARADALSQVTAAVGIDAAVAMFPLCADKYCGYCKTPPVPRPVAPSSRALFAGALKG